MVPVAGEAATSSPETDNRRPSARLHHVARHQFSPFPDFDDAIDANLAGANEVLRFATRPG
jgi:hypothetical protein